ncbi:penicillin acylase family protein [Atopomonas sediminilitoris]|uniref:penicillin acylase family protein n=1 Tax=Atopomonas sediminilitoris TaxID=2919919 RepID=UPI001F4EC25C|nr:penicillin acylase family protein [Atopomonas sediminilitoris]MCJ8169687.1 penicillin acylase family protein [Atopomonas sediminilitoris]
MRRLLPRLRVLLLSSVAASTLLLAGCQSWLADGSSVHPTRGNVKLKGLADNVWVRRNALGMPLIESRNFHDALFTLGYIHAADRLSQMIGMRLVAEGRLAEMVGPAALELDQFMRALQLREQARALYKHASPRIQQFFEVYARGVNAYIYRYQDRLPADLKLAGHHPAYWQPEDSALLFALVNQALAANLPEEIASLALAQKVGADKLAWLTPIYPDEDLPFAEADKLKGLDLSASADDIQRLTSSLKPLQQLANMGVAASNNWAVMPSHSQGGKAMLANDTHLPLAMPSLWNYVHIRSPKYQAAGVSLAGIPAIVAGFNGKLAWGMTMVMGDNQDLFLEQLKTVNGRLHYRRGERWLPARERRETFFIKGERPQRLTFHHTDHGPLLNPALGEHKHMLQPNALSTRYGLALKSAAADASAQTEDRTLDAFFELSRAQSVDQAAEHVRDIRGMALNLLYADADNIAWQVTGRYPYRKAGRGLIPSPAWQGDYDWEGYADSMLHPYEQNPSQGWLGTANHRSVPPGYGVQLSASWYYPERAERIAELLNAKRSHNSASFKAMHYDQKSLFVAKLQSQWADSLFAPRLQQAIQALPAAQRAAAEQSLARLSRFDGQLRAESADAALWGAFLQQAAEAIFLDELGPKDSSSWQAFVTSNDVSYSAVADHLLGREDSPFWNDTRSATTEDKPAILARSLAQAWQWMQQTQGQQPSRWQWGQLHTYHWQTDASLLAPHMSALEQTGIKALQGLFDRGPYPAGGDHTTLNVSAWHWGDNFNTWLIPAMRLIVDFNQEEPMQALNSSGQSGDPASPHYDDGIKAWQQGQYQSFPFQSRNLDKTYGTERLLLLPE